jgi:hypothetical protein
MQMQEDHLIPELPNTNIRLTWKKYPSPEIASTDGLRTI